MYTYTVSYTNQYAFTVITLHYSELSALYECEAARRMGYEPQLLLQAAEN